MNPQLDPNLTPGLRSQIQDYSTVPQPDSGLKVILNDSELGTQA